ncbi:hypothetical protein M1328_01670 [Patescibacteria group bacterium]|nr:hypothetical protein [Patescibacteria group bacterium]
MTNISYKPFKIDFKVTKFKDETWSYIAPTWEEMGELYLNLGAEILESDLKFDCLITLAKGGWTWSRTMADILNIDEIHSFKLSLYDDVEPGKILSKPRLELPLTVALDKKRVLFFDDVDDTGQSLIWSLKYLDFYNVKSVKTATLFHKPHSKFVPDFYGFETPSWIIFPHERREGIVGLAKKWLNNGMTASDARLRLKKIGLPEKEVDLFFKVENLR